MPADRPAIPAELKRRVLVEAGHRCAIPTCRHPAYELAHIEPWARVHEHTFENLIALCPNDHTRYDKGEIDRKAMRIYKANLGLLNGRYGDFERRVLDDMVLRRELEIRLPAGYRPLLGYLIRDGLLSEPQLDSRFGSMLIGDMPAAGVEVYRLTSDGLKFAEDYANARSLAPDQT